MKKAKIITRYHVSINIHVSYKYEYITVTYYIVTLLIYINLKVFLIFFLVYEKIM